MRRLRFKPGWFRQTLPGQFLLAGGAVMLGAMLVVGTWVAGRIEQGVVENSAVAAALYMESFISPLSQELADTEGLSPPARQALHEIFASTALGERVVAYKIWKPGGLVVEASDPALEGRRFEQGDDLKTAWTGVIGASFQDLNDQEDEGEAELGIPLLEVYSPIRELWTGEIIAVAEFYERADELARELADAQRKSWLVVSGVFLTSGLLLFGIVQAGGRTIERQQADLETQLVETRRVSEQNRALRERVMAAATRSTAQAERVMQRVGLDLHDGVAQHLSLASLRLDEALRGAGGSEAGTVRDALDAAMRELRAISRGLALPDLEHLDAEAVVRRAVDDHRRAFGTEVALETGADGAAPRLPYAARLCLYRFLQEGLSNAHRHAGGTGVAVSFRAGPGGVEATVSDRGPGFDPAAAVALRADGGQGLLGLRDRAETLGGQVRVHAAPGEGSQITLTLPVEEQPA
jgi:signal transduction histidine kinase